MSLFDPSELERMIERILMYIVTRTPEISQEHRSNILNHIEKLKGLVERTLYQEELKQILRDYDPNRFEQYVQRRKEGLMAPPIENEKDFYKRLNELEQRYYSLSSERNLERGRYIPRLVKYW